MSDNNQRQFASMYPNNLSHERVLSRWGSNGEGTASNLNLTVTGNTLRMKIYTGLSEDKQKDNKSIDFQFGAQTIVSFFAIVDSLKDLMAIPLENGPQKRAFAIRNYRHKVGVVEVGRIIVGRDAEGVYYITGVNETHGKVKFDLTMDRDITMFEIGSSEPAAPSVVSKRYTETWIEAVKLFLAPIMVDQFVDTQKDKQQGGNQRQGGGNKGNWNKGGNGGGYNKGNYGNGGGYNKGGNGGGYNNNGGNNYGGGNNGNSNSYNNPDNSPDDFLP